MPEVKNDPFEISRALVLSTAHLRAETARKWDHGVFDGDSHTTNGIRVSFGYIVLLHDSMSEENGDEPELMAAAELAYQKKCKILRYDCDGPVYGGILATFEW